MGGPSRNVFANHLPRRNFLLNKTEKPFSLLDDEMIDIRDKDYNTFSVTNFKRSFHSEKCFKAWVRNESFSAFLLYDKYCSFFYYNLFWIRNIYGCLFRMLVSSVNFWWAIKVQLIHTFQASWQAVWHSQARILLRFARAFYWIYGTVVFSTYFKKTIIWSRY